MTTLKHRWGLEKANSANINYNLNLLKESAKQVEYYDFELKQTTNVDEAKYEVVKTSMDNKYGQQLAMTFGRNSIDNKFKLFYMSSYERCLRVMQPGTPDGTNTDTGVEAQYNLDRITKSIADMSLFKEAYYERNLAALDNMIRAYEGKIKYEVRANICENYLVNRDRTYVMYNTGIIDKFGEQILVMQELSGTVLQAKQLVTSVQMLESRGFSEYYIEPVRLYNKKEELMFDCSISSIDIKAARGREHIISERRQRFPDDVAQLTDIELYNRIKESIDFGLKMCKRDVMWALPFYCIEENEIQWLMPLYATGNFTGKADAALIVKKVGGHYVLKTLIPIELAYNNASAVSEPKCIWV